jgi:hypothetical protein
MKKTAILFSFFVLLLAGCEKTSTTTNTSTPSTPEGSSIVAEQTFSDINTFADNFFSESGLKSSPTGLTCPTVSWNLASLPFSLVFDWGTGCTGTDGVLRKGKISISLTGLMTAVNSIATFTFDNYYAGGLKITGTHSITYVGLNSGNNWPRYQIATDARFDFPDGKFMTYHANYWRLLSAGSETASISDDVWRIEGASSGTTADGISWQASCTNALVKPMSCRWFTSGILTVTPSGLSPVTIDFGDGTCDNKASVIKNGLTTIIELR